MLRIANLEAGYGSLRVIKGVSLHVSPGEVVAIIGPNGAGKTTLLATIAGLIEPRTGEISLQGRRIEQAPPEQIVALGCSLVPEGRQVFGPLTVKENLLLGGYVRRRERANGAEQTLEGVYRLFGVLRERQRQLAATLSGGEQQMLAIGRALMARPRLLMMDEPSLGIAPRVVQTIFRTITELRDAGMTILLIEQNARSALRIADRGYVLETGQIVCEGSARELLDNRDVQRAYLGKDYRTIDE
ncbi:MAG: ABC transporter ATP-binding protein [Candidatus Brocadiia bacterium]|jgi:branched-chain amino acid transport system ATP-binding protein